MKPRPSFFIALFLVASIGSGMCAFAQKAVDVRMAHWGMTEQEVEASETGRLEFSGEELHTDGVTLYRDRALRFGGIEVAGCPASVTYFFRDGGLIAASVTIQALPLSDANNQLTAYARINELLQSENGEPYHSGVVWHEDSVNSNAKQDVQTAVNESRADRLTEWRTERSQILHRLSYVRGFYTWEHVIKYISLESFKGEIPDCW